MYVGKSGQQPAVADAALPAPIAATAVLADVAQGTGARAVMLANAARQRDVAVEKVARDVMDDLLASGAKGAARKGKAAAAQGEVAAAQGKENRQGAGAKRGAEGGEPQPKRVTRAQLTRD